MRFGILGGGQLGKMLALSALKGGSSCKFLSPTADVPCAHCGDLVVGEYADLDVLDRFLEGVDIVTLEFENVPVETARYLESRVQFFPSSKILELGQDRILEKELFRALGIPSPGFMAVDSWADLQKAAAVLGFPLVLKTRRLGYDGKGQAVVRDAAHARAAFDELGATGLIAEEFVAFSREIAITGVNAPANGEVAFYPLSETIQTAGILRYCRARPAEPLQRTAEEYLQRVFTHVGYRGVLTIEFFEKDGALVANELAPRVHNSAHWTIEGAETSQFENHLRAGSGEPLGSTAPRGFAATINVVSIPPDLNDDKIRKLLGEPGTHLHLYGKTPARRRKLGHLTLVADTVEKLSERLDRALTFFPEEQWQ